MPKILDRELDLNVFLNKVPTDIRRIAEFAGEHFGVTEQHRFLQHYRDNTSYDPGVFGAKEAILNFVDEQSIDLGSLWETF